MGANKTGYVPSQKLLHKIKMNSELPSITEFHPPVIDSKPGPERAAKVLAEYRANQAILKKLNERYL